MPFVEKLVSCRSLSIVGMSKNAGKTETLNYVLRRLVSEGQRSLAVTSIGIDGERRDQVSQTDKPEITFTEGITFATSEKHYLERRLMSEVIDVSPERTALGRLVIGRALGSGKLLISGPSTTDGIIRFIDQMQRLGIDLTLIDGALSRLSLASPAVTDGMILATGAAVSTDLDELLRRTKALYRLIRLPRIASSDLAARLSTLPLGVYGISETGEVEDLGLQSALVIPRAYLSRIQHFPTLYVSGAINERLFEALRLKDGAVRLIARDFTRIFTDDLSVSKFIRAGGRLEVLYATRLLAVTVNPLAPSGFCLDSARLRAQMSEALGVSVYDVKQLE